MTEISQHARNTRHDRRETDDGVQRGNHLRELDGSDASANDRPRRPAQRGHRSELHEDLGREADCGQGGEDTRAHTQDAEDVALPGSRLRAQSGESAWHEQRGSRQVSGADDM